MGSIVQGGFDIAAAEEQKKGGGGIPQYPKRALAEKILDNDTLNILRQERQLVDDALAQGAFLQPEMYRALGYEPVYDEREGADLQGAADRLDELEQVQRQRTALTQELKDLGPIRKRTVVTGEGRFAKSREKVGPKSRERIARRNELKKQLKQLPKGDELKKSLNKAQDELSSLQSLPRRVVGIRPLDGGADPTGSKGGAFREAFDLQNETLNRALKGEEPIDPTLRRAFDEKERALREQLRRQFGPDFESADAAREILSNFDRERAEAFAQYNREQIESYSSMTGERAGLLSDLTSARLGQLQEPVKAQFTRAGALSGLGQDIRSTTAQREERRRTLFDVQTQQFQNRLINSISKAEGLSKEGSAIGSIVNTLIAAAAGGGAGGAAGATAGSTGGAAGGAAGGGLLGLAKSFGGGLMSVGKQEALSQSR